MLLDRYNQAIDELIAKVRTTQRENVIRAGEMIADTVASGGNVYLWFFLVQILAYMALDMVLIRFAPEKQ